MRMQFISTKTAVFFLTFLSVLLFIPFLGNVHLFDWDEINFAEIAREMVVSKNYSEPQINFQLFTEKPPLYFWLQAISMNIFGVNEFAARFPNALLSVLTLPILFLIGRKLKDNLFGFLWAIVYTASILPHLYFKSGIIDPWFNFFILISLYALITIAQKKGSSTKWMVIGGVMLGLAILTKGPAALIIIGLTFTVHLISKKFRFLISPLQLLLFVLIAFATAGLWLGIDYLQYGDKFIKEFTIRQWELLTTPDAGHGGFLLYHFVVLFFGCFPATGFFIYALIKKDTEDEHFAEVKKWMRILFWVVLLLFTFVQTKIVHYSSLCYYPICFLAAVSLYNIITQKWKLNSWVKILIIISGIPFIVAPFAFAWFGKNISSIKSLAAKDRFAFENMDAAVYWSGWEFIPGLILIITLILSLRYFSKQKNKIATWVLAGGSIIFIQLSLFFLIGRIESYSQRANIEFWQSHSNEDCYMTSYKYKTYTNYFYGNAKPQLNKNYLDSEWLLKGNIDKTVYISCRVNKKESLEKELLDASFLYNKNGFYFYKRVARSNIE